MEKEWYVVNTYSGHESKVKEKSANYLPQEEDYPEDCFIDFDFRLIDIFERMKKANQKLEDMVIEEFYKIKADL